MVKGKQARKRNRRLPDPAVPPVYALANVTAVHFLTTNTISITFDQPVQISGDNLPTYWVFGTGSLEITSLISSTATLYHFGINGGTAASEPYLIGANDPAVRTPTGGFVAGRTGTIAA